MSPPPRPPTGSCAVGGSAPTTPVACPAGCVNTVHFSPCGELLISGSDDRTIRFWDHETGAQRLCYASGHHDNVFQARIIPESSNASVVSCAADGEVRVGHISPGGGALQTRKLGSHSGRAHKLALCPQHPATFLSCGEDGAVNFFDLRQPSHSNHRLLVCRAFMVSAAGRMEARLGDSLESPREQSPGSCVHRGHARCAARAFAAE